MTSYFYYIEAGADIDCTTKLYHVKVGTSAQANRDFLFLTAYAVDHGHYFEIRSQKSSEFIQRVKDNYRGVMVDPWDITVSARELVKHFKQGYHFPHQQRTLDNADYQKTVLNLDYRTAKFFRR